MVWNVYREDFNHRAIVEYNIFDHSGFAQDVNKLLKAYAHRLKQIKCKRTGYCVYLAHIVHAGSAVYHVIYPHNALAIEHGEYPFCCGAYPFGKLI